MNSGEATPATPSDPLLIVKVVSLLSPTSIAVPRPIVITPVDCACVSVVIAYSAAVDVVSTDIPTTKGESARFVNPAKGGTSVRLVLPVATAVQL